MKKQLTYIAGLVTVLGGLTVSGCKPQTTTEKMKDGVEDTSHEVGQGMERAGERVKDAAN